MMLRWNDLHPYNAVHVVRISASLDLARLKSNIATTLQSLTLGEIALNSPSKPIASTQCETRNAEPPEILLLASNSPATLHSEIQRQLNTPFLCGPRIHPFRFFVQADGALFFLGVTYFHPIADAESIVWFLKECVEAYSLRATAESGRLSVEMYPEMPGSFFLRHPQVALRRARAVITTARAMRKCFRPPVRNHADFNNGFLFFLVTAKHLRDLVAASKSWDVTLNDVFLALLLKSVSPLASRRHASGKRKRIGIGCIVNLRKDLGLASRPVFGLFLGSFVLTHEAPDTLSLEALSRDVHCETARIKARRLALGTPVELVFGRLLFSLFSTERQKKLYQKNYPLWGGITNMNLNSIWPQHNDSSFVDYFRAVSTGPATPLVFSLTTSGDHLNIGLTFRTTVFSDSDIAQIKRTFLDHIDQLGAKT
jgi:NRPS condensation-like uncharacterized protein